MPRSFTRVATRLWLAAVVVGVGARPAAAQSRTLAWPEVRVTAHLEADGSLSVVERQRIVFDGAWNGGERRFDVRDGQEFEVLGMKREGTQGFYALRGGSVETVDSYNLFDGNVLRWRSRSPGAPPFVSDTLTYEISAVYRYVLQYKRGGTFQLDHDFAFRDRVAPIERFLLQVTLDSAWRAPTSFTGRFEARTLRPGEGFVVNIPLQRVAVDAPTAVRMPDLFGTRFRVFAGIVLVLAFILRRIVTRDVRLHGLGPEPSIDDVTPVWLGDHVFAHPPELIGAAWDGNVGQAEVTAVLARMEQEGKLATHLTVPDLPPAIAATLPATLGLTLKVPRAQLPALERDLVDALFLPGQSETDVDRVKARYAKTGFNPADAVRETLLGRVDQLWPSAEASHGAIAIVALACGVLGFGAVIMLTLGGGMDWRVLLRFGLPMFVLNIIAGMAAGRWRRSALLSRGAAVIGLTALVGGLVLYHYHFVAAYQVPIGTGQWLIWSACFFAMSVCALLNGISTESAPRMALRQRLTVARQWFARELEREQPALQEAWTPYLLALGLGRNVDAWRVEAERAGPSGGSGRSSSASGGVGGAVFNAGSAVPNAFTGFGGGGGFSGAGGGSSWDDLSAIAAPVPAPSSSGSSGGGGGGGGGGGSSGGGGGSSGSSSSGGGGGGGW